MKNNDWKAEAFRQARASRADLIENLCPECGGSGYLTYGNTATWRGGAGGQSLTQGVCNKCWGSGDADRPWTSWREIEKNGLAP